MKEIQKDGGEMKRETFIKQIKNGEITDFSKYLAVENRQIWYRVEMAKLGVCVEELAQMGEQRVQAALVENGYAKQYYQQWAREDQKDVVYELVRKGYCTDILENSKHNYVLIKLINKGLAKHKWTEWAKSASYSVKLELLRYEEYAQIMVHDSIDEIRTRAARRYPKLVKQLIGKKGMSTFETIRDILASQPAPDRETFDYYMEFRKRYEGSRLLEHRDKALVEKYNALKLPVSPIEATMTWEQLYAINNPRWMNSLSAYDIIDIKNQ